MKTFFFVPAQTVTASIKFLLSFMQYDLPYRNIDNTPVAASLNDFLDGVFVGFFKPADGATTFSSNIWSGARGIMGSGVSPPAGTGRRSLLGY